MLPDPSNSYGGEIDENPDRPRIRTTRRLCTRGELYFTRRGARRRARKLAAVRGVCAILVLPTGRRRWEWEVSWLAEPSARDGYHR